MVSTFGSLAASPLPRVTLVMAARATPSIPGLRQAGAMTEVKETQLPGVGVRHEFTTAAGERLVVLSHRTGRKELAFYDQPDPDVCRTVLHLSPDDTRTLAELLGGSPVSEAVVGVQRLEGLAIDWIQIPPSAGLAGATIGDGGFRTRTGASVVAIVRGSDTVPAPGPDERLEPRDVVVAVGTSEGLRQLRELLEA
jgi:TrkA domain protein